MRGPWRNCCGSWQHTKDMARDYRFSLLAFFGLVTLAALLALFTIRHLEHRAIEAERQRSEEKRKEELRKLVTELGFDQNSATH